jgi:hypothetical protein
VHRHQLGEPLLNEVVQAALWVRFLDAENLWVLQRNLLTGRYCPQETPAVRPHPQLLDQVVAARLDTARWFEAHWVTEAYSVACLWASMFDWGRIRYRQYLDGICWLLLRVWDPRWIRRATVRLLKDLRHPMRVPALPIE